MKKKICIILALVLLLPGILLAYGASLPEYYGDSYYAQLPELYEKLKTTEGKKVIIVGGSNIAFGVDSAQMEHTLRNCGYDYTVCNFGLYAAIGTSAMLELSRDFIGEGDIVILAIEPTDETFSTYFGATAMHKAAEKDPEMLLHLNKLQKSNLVGNYISYLQERAAIQRTGILPQVSGVYAKSSFDKNGDMVYDRAGNAMLLGYDTGTPIDLENITFSQDFVEQVNDYAAQAQQKGATVYMSFSPMNRGAVADISEEIIYDYFCKLQDAFRCQIISDPNDYLMESGWFYDSNFHLNNAGMEIRTYRLSCDLLNHLGYFGDVPFHMPQMPPSIAQVEENEANSSDFLFESIGGNGLLISGLTEAGKEKSSLLIPSSYGGKPVVGITATAFAGNTALTALTLPATIESIPDGAFSGCVNLKKLTLLHQQTTPTVGEGLLDGAEQVTIFVPSNAYHLYRDGAGCATNPWEAYLDRIKAY